MKTCPSEDAEEPFSRLWREKQLEAIRNGVQILNGLLNTSVKKRDGRRWREMEGDGKREIETEETEGALHLGAFEMYRYIRWPTSRGSSSLPLLLLSALRLGPGYQWPVE